MVVLLITGLLIYAATPVPACLVSPEMQPSFGERRVDRWAEPFRFADEALWEGIGESNVPAVFSWGAAFPPDYTLDWWMPPWVGKVSHKPSTFYHGLIFMPIGGWSLVRPKEPGDPVATPIPGAIWLLSSGLVAIGVADKQVRKRAHDH
jgi:hypothetical protein